MRQEPHRVYWQQWVTTSTEQPQTRRNLLTSSAAVRISDAARAVDVTQLLRQTITNLGGSETDDALVLVGTLYNTDPVQFEHETTPHSTNSESLHVVRTLKADENPLAVRDVLLERLKQRQRKGISPKLQWFFVPSSANLPNCIELDGYCTSEENQDSQDSEDSGEEEELQNDGDQDCWWRNASPPSDSSVNGNSQSNCYKLLDGEQRRLNQLRNCQSALDCISGYLLKRSNKDRHVWKRVYCVLTDDHLWSVSRLHTIGGNNIAKHGRIALNRALLLEATADYAPLYRTPHAFEVVSRSGISHVFRATNRALQLRWIQCLSDRIVQCHENKVLEHAELIVEDEALAHNKRLSALAIEPLMTAYAEMGDDGFLMNVLRWGIEVAEYREQCRHVQSRMPAKRIVIAAAAAVLSAGDNPAAPSPRRLFESPKGNKEEEIVDSEMRRDMIRSAWDSAATLLVRATHLANERNGKRMRNLEMLCQHVDYVITGRFRPFAEAAAAAGEMEHTERNVDPPPVNLFDPLLQELQWGYSAKETPDGHAKPIETPLGKS
jgi:hypothetical protein